MKRNIIMLFFIALSGVIVFITIASLDFNKNKTNKEDINIVTSFYPIYIMTKNITNDIDNVSVTNMTDFNIGCLHDYTLTPNDMKKIEESDMFIINGEGMESFLSDALKDKNINIIDSSEEISVIKDGNEINAHIWNDPLRYILQVKNITNVLEKYDPDNSEKYENNSVEYIDKLLEINDSRKELRKYTDNIIIFHESVEYFLDGLNLNLIYTVDIDDDETLSANEITNIINKIKENNVKVILVEKQFNNDIINTIRNEVDVDFYELDTGVTGDDSLNSYIDSMNYNILTLKEALNEK